MKQKYLTKYTYGSKNMSGNIPAPPPAGLPIAESQAGPLQPEPNVLDGRPVEISVPAKTSVAKVVEIPQFSWL